MDSLTGILKEVNLLFNFKDLFKFLILSCNILENIKIDGIWMCILFSIDDNTFFFYGKDKANERAGHLMVSDYRRPRPRATPEELQVRCRPPRTVGSPALPNAKRSSIKPLLNAGLKCRGWSRSGLPMRVAIAGDVTLPHVL